MDAVHTNVIKRNGEEVNFDLDKIVNAINAANKEVDRLHQLNDYQVQAIADNIAKQIEIMTHAIHVEDIQDMVETGIMEMRGYEVAQKYVRYRYKRELARKSNTTDNGILALIDHMNEEVNQENSNKNPVINSTQRDYMAGEVSKDLTKRMLLPKEIVEAHEQGIIHFHDSDYFAQREHNCDLVNLEDMLQNGTVISETMIEKPHSFFTACNVTTQIVAQVDLLPTLMTMVACGQGISILHRDMLPRSNGRIAFVPLRSVSYFRRWLMWDINNDNPCLQPLIALGHKWQDDLEYPVE